ncbi:hypothetical protein BDZ97DRAFT_1784198 [Flammula alnicola]|nr:hypothetical protein BDZ97DRAFT_1784198 [Flammula alnicola]
MTNSKTHTLTFLIFLQKELACSLTMHLNFFHFACRPFDLALVFSRRGYSNFEVLAYLTDQSFPWPSCWML